MHFSVAQIKFWVQGWVMHEATNSGEQNAGNTPMHYTPEMSTKEPMRPINQHTDTHTHTHSHTSNMIRSNFWGAWLRNTCCWETLCIMSFSYILCNWGKEQTGARVHTRGAWGTRTVFFSNQICSKSKKNNKTQNVVLGPAGKVVTECEAVRFSDSTTDTDDIVTVKLDFWHVWCVAIVRPSSWWMSLGMV